VPIHAAADALASYLHELKRRRFSDSLHDRTARVVGRFFEYLAEHRVHDVRAVKEEHVVGFGRQLQRTNTCRGRRPSPVTVAHYLNDVRRFFSFLVRRRRLLTNPARNVHVPRVDVLPRHVLSVSQARRLMNAPFPVYGRWWAQPIELRDRAILELLYGSGLRRSECVRLQVTDLDLAQGRLLVRNGKGRKDRVVPVPARAAEALDLYVREARWRLARHVREGALFITYQSGRRISASALEAMIRTRSRAARLDGVHPHALRHACATHLLDGGADVRHVQELLGHARLDSTARYTRVAIKHLQGVIERCHPRGRAQRSAGGNIHASDTEATRAWVTRRQPRRPSRTSKAAATTLTSRNSASRASS
jgi:integrase/recombinase XerD